MRLFHRLQAISVTVCLVVNTAQGLTIARSSSSSHLSIPRHLSKEDNLQTRSPITVDVTPINPFSKLPSPKEVYDNIKPNVKLSFGRNNDRGDGGNNGNGGSRWRSNKNSKSNDDQKDLAYVPLPLPLAISASKSSSNDRKSSSSSSSRNDRDRPSRKGSKYDDEDDN